MPFQHDQNINDVCSFIERNGGSHTSHLNLLNDKRFYWTNNKQILITYQLSGNTCVVLGDPLGKENLVSEAIMNFVQHCSDLGIKAAFYHVSPRYLNYFQNEGYRITKLGEEGRVYLPDFSMAGKNRAKLRTRKNKFEREGYQFAVLYPPYSEQFVEELSAISNSWLGKRKEKGFSVGFFCKDYISHFPVGIVKNPHGKIIAFATLASNYQENERTITIDLMRYIPDSPHATMDFLFLSIFHWCKEQDYHWCSMGTSPLANTGETDRNDWFQTTIGKFIFHKGNFFYNFKGLYEYKNKFQPEWESRYLVYEQRSLPLLFMRIIRLIHAKPRSQENPFIHISNRIRKLKRAS
ncbi:phosphatidylglycerol lysyltransferase domain-containing protein [Bacillus sp. V5-8f]|uniref:phosphatidylglycerol lysyltransferase domain-containing protein n=1 Tax=Bacillus sp. V5-8f TaxID=2053044 RepID=UPI000C765F7D|nr:phosphatidylglycerol lysyltransferase domain-containing protein [Bacillus sp. V5-8f]PLT35634.1 hypothetical protein CUU64_03250 [Bacillus sp. V5-8f]